MSESCVTEQMLNEFAKRIDAEDKRQDERLENLERNVQTVNAIAISVEKLAINMELLTKEVSKQGIKLNDLEMKPAKRWDLVITTLIAGIVGALVGFISSGIMP